MNTDLQILYQDEQIVAVNKPAGIVSIPDGYHPNLPCMNNLMKAQFPGIWNVHRLDKDTSGVLIFALDALTHRALSIQFEHHSITKSYTAVMKGSPEWDQLSVTLPLRINGDRQHRTVIDPENGKLARTDFKVVERFAMYTWISARPRTGYTHQIRAHAAAVGFPLLGDPLYWIPTKPKSDFILPSNLPIHRVCLHAASIAFLHPSTNLPIELSAPLPQDLIDLYQYLES